MMLPPQSEPELATPGRRGQGGFNSMGTSFAWNEIAAQGFRPQSSQGRAELVALAQPAIVPDGRVEVGSLVLYRQMGREAVWLEAQCIAIDPVGSRSRPGA